MNWTQYNRRQALEIMSTIATMQAEHEKELLAKNEEIEYWKRAAEQAIKSRHRALYSHKTKIKQYLEYGVCLVLCSSGLAMVFAALISFWEWANQ